MTSPFGPHLARGRRADRAEKMPAPITAPIASMTRSPAPSTRFSDVRALGRQQVGDRLAREELAMRGCRRLIRSSKGTAAYGVKDKTVSFDATTSRPFAPNASAHQSRARHRPVFAPPRRQSIDPADAGQRIDDVQDAVGVEREPLRAAEGVGQRSTVPSGSIR